jgi:hypothetical protein
MTTKKEEKHWVVTDGLTLSDTLHTSLKDAQKEFEQMLGYDEIDDSWYIQEVTLGTKYLLEQEPKWVEVK